MSLIPARSMSRAARLAACVAVTACSPALRPVAVAPVVDVEANTQRPDSASAALSRERGMLLMPDSARPVVTTPIVTRADVARQAIAVFGDSLPMQASDSDATEPAATWDIDVHSFEGQARVEHWVRVLSGNARGSFEAQVQRGVRYEPMLRAKLRAGGIPEDMVYLALIESGFSAHAYSRAAAVGMWQFMTTTARDAGLRVDWWVDERRDPVRSTDAAVRFINELRQQFGSLYLAAAAYNGGPGRIARGLNRYADDFEGTTGDSLFFALAERNVLRPETREYVPKLIAAAIVAKEPVRYGMHIEQQSPFAYDSVRVPASTPLLAGAHAARATLAEIQDLNPHVLRGVTPPEGTFLLRVPVGHADGFANALSALPDEERSAFTRVESKKGQTFASIGTRAGVSAKHLAWYNPNVTTTKKGALHAGQVVRIPTHAVLAAAVEVPDPGIERYGSSRTARLHTVKSGETLSSIASRYGTTVPALMRANRLRKKVIVPGQQIAVRGTAPSSRTSSVKSTGTRRKSPAKHASASRSSSRLKSKAKPAKHPAKGHRA